MTRTNHFSDAFWGSDFCSTSGFDAIVRRMKDGRTIVKNVAEFLKQRARLESDFATGLQRLAGKVDRDFSLETGSMKMCLDAVRMNTQKMADEHFMCSKSLSDSAERLNSYQDKLKRDRTAEEDVMRRANDKKTTLFRRHQEAKRVYLQKSRDAEESEKTTAQMKQNQASVTTKTWDNVIQTNEKAKQEQLRSDQLYKESVNQLDEARDQWQKDMQRFCEASEQQDIARMKQLQNELWAHSNIISDTCVADDNHCESVRLSLDKLDAAADIADFSEKNKTGSNKPVPVLYEPYQGSVLFASNSRGMQQQPTPSSTQHQPMRPPNNPPAGAQGGGGVRSAGGGGGGRSAGGGGGHSNPTMSGARSQTIAPRSPAGGGHVYPSLSPSSPYPPQSNGGQRLPPQTQKSNTSTSTRV